MRRFFAVLAFFTFLSTAQGQDEEIHKIENAKKEMYLTISTFSTCLVDNPVDSCKGFMAGKYADPYKAYVAAGIVFNSLPALSFQLHEYAWKQEKSNAHFTLEYALELHRAREYQKAVRLYKDYLRSNPADTRINALLADCYLNLTETGKAAKTWTECNYNLSHREIDFAINSVYGSRVDNPYKIRSELLAKAGKGDHNAFLELVYLDLNWKADWWTTVIKTDFLDHDIRLAKSVMGEKSEAVRVLESYRLVKVLKEYGVQKDSVASAFLKSGLLLHHGIIPKSGNVAKDLVIIALNYHFISPSEFFLSRGYEIFEAAKVQQDVEMLNLYAFLEEVTTGKVLKTIDLMGWKQFHDERFAISFLISKSEELAYEDSDLKSAIIDFPESSKLLWIKASCAKTEQRDIKPALVELIKTEFRSLETDPQHNSYSLNYYFWLLNKLMEQE